MFEKGPRKVEPYEVLALIREHFREDFEFAAAPLRDVARTNYEGALKFAENGIRALFGLNGGGLIALPAFAALFKTDMHAAAVWILSAAAFFVVGLISAALTCLLGYLSAMQAVEAANSSFEAVGTKYARHYEQVPETPAMAHEIKAAENAAARSTNLSMRSRAFAVAFGIVSLVAFVIAVGFAFWALAPLKT